MPIKGKPGRGFFRPIGSNNYQMKTWVRTKGNGSSSMIATRV
ncbi:hypothetical protein [Stenotrophomonas phage RAS14]